MQDFISRCTSLNIPAEKYGRRLIWHDEFNREKIDEEKWTFFRSMNCENRIYNNDTRHARIENSNLQLQIYREDDGKYSLPEGLATKETMLFKYGYVEMRAKIPFRHCAWPSFWMLGNTPFHNEKIGWFAEIDIFEVFSSENLLIPNLHKWGKAGHEMLTGSENDIVRAYQFKNNKTLNDEYHIYGFEWDAHEVKFFVDNECYYHFPIDENSGFTSAVYPDTGGFHEPLYIIINNEMFTKESEWYPCGSAATAEDSMPINYCVDWVRLYQNPETESIYLKNDISEAEIFKKS